MTATLRTTLLTLLACCAASALAHAELASSTPGNGETVTTAPSEIELVFSEGVEQGVSIFKVYPLPEDLAAAEASAIQDESMQPLDDSNGDAGDDSSDDHGDDDHDHSGTSSDDQGDDASDDTTGDDSHDHSLETSSGVAAFVASVIGTEGDEAQRVDTGVSFQGSEVSLELTDDLPAGWYVAMWRALSDDGHAVEGAITFHYAP